MGEKEISAAKENSQTKCCLAEPCLPPLPGKEQEKEADHVNATDLIPV